MVLVIGQSAAGDEVVIGGIVGQDTAQRGVVGMIDAFELTLSVFAQSRAIEAGEVVCGVFRILHQMCGVV